MKRHTLFIYVYPKMVFVILLTIVISLVYSIYTIENYVIKESNLQLEQAAKTIIQFSNTYFNSLEIEYNQDTLVSEVKRKSELFNLRLSLFDSYGNLIIDTENKGKSKENHKNRPEIKDALQGEIGKSVRKSSVLNTKMAYVAVPLKKEDKIIGIVRASKKLSSLDNVVYEMSRNVILFGLIVLFLSSWLIFVITKHYTTILKELKEGALNFSRGELDLKVKIPNIDEMAYVAESMNKMATNISERITTIELQSDEIRRRKEELLSTFKSITDGVLTFDLDKKVVFMNQSSELLLEWSRNELQGQCFDDYIKFYEETDMTLMNSMLDEMINVGEKELTTEPVVYISKYQKRLVFELVLSPVRNEKNEIAGGVLVIKDITSNREIERELTKLKKLESVGRLAGGIAHDFNNLLAGILGGVNLALHTMSPKEKAFKHLKIAEKACKRATDLTQKLLTFSKGGAPIKTTSKIDEIVKDSAEFVLHGSNTRLEMNIDPKLWSADVDRGQISQVVQNLVINGVQAIDGQGKIVIKCRNRIIETGELVLVEEGKYIEIIIEDNGSGIEKSKLEHIFDPYFTTKKDGNGLGLAVTYSIIKKHNGHVFVTSTEGEGTIFKILIPSIGKEHADIEKEKDIVISSKVYEIPIHSTNENEEKLVVVMDDEELIRETSLDMLEMLNYKVKTVEDSESLFEILENESVSAVILDLTIPGGKGGKEIIGDINNKYPHVKAIVSSGYSSDPIMAQYVEYGFDGVVKKPYSFEELSQELNRVFYS